jgi:spore coat protein CotH
MKTTLAINYRFDILLHFDYSNTINVYRAITTFAYLNNTGLVPAELHSETKSECSSTSRLIPIGIFIPE